MPTRMLRRAIIASLTLWALPASAQLAGARMWAVADTASTVRIAIASSGAVSIGSYQAGLDWALVEFLRYARDHADLRAAYRLPHYRVVGLSGASAGNFNSLLVAVDLCDASPPQVAEQSAMWAMWTQIGIEQLLPLNGSYRGELGLLDRSFLRTVLKEQVAARVRQPAPPGCDVPVSLTLSKLVPDPLPLNGYVSASVQRFVSAYRVASTAVAPGTTGPLGFFAPSAAFMRDTAIGKQLVPFGVRDGGDVAFERVFELVEASASMGYLFSPVPLAYCDAAVAAARGGCGPASGTAAGALAPTTRARFVDGGVVDDLPAYLALQWLRGDTLSPTSAARGVVVVGHRARRGDDTVRAPRDEDAFRPVDGICKQAGDPDHCGGLMAFMQFLGGLKQSGAHYELHSLIRARASNGDMRGPDIDVVTRHPAIVGERIASNAAFLGRPFREFDFQAGIYDALHYVASAVLCRPEHRRAGDTSGPDACVADRVRELADWLPLSCVSVQTVDLLLAEEYGATSGRRPGGRCAVLAPPDSARAAAYRSVFVALHTVNNDSLRNCAGRGPIGGLLCRDGTIGVFAQLRRDAGFMQYVRDQWAGCQRRVATVLDDQARRALHAECFVDEDFLFTLDDPEAGFFRRLRQVLDRMQWVEEEVEVQEAGASTMIHYDAATQVLNFVGRSALLAEESGWMMFPTVVPERRNAWRVLTGLLMPQELEIQMKGAGYSLNWRPVALKTSRRVGLEVGVGVANNYFASRLRPNDQVNSPARVTATAIATWRPLLGGGVLVSTVGAGVRYWHPGTDDRAGGAASFTRESLAPQARADVLWDRVGVTVTKTPRYAGTGDRQKWMVSLSVNDPGGFLYWLVRSRELR